MSILMLAALSRVQLKVCVFESAKLGTDLLQVLAVYLQVLVVTKALLVLRSLQRHHLLHLVIQLLRRPLRRLPSRPPSRPRVTPSIR
jgi:hypothetical protein